MTDMDLLKAACKARGLAWHPLPAEQAARFGITGLYLPGKQRNWNPLTRPADALEHAVKMDVWPYAAGPNRIGIWTAMPDGTMQDTYGADCWWGPEFEPKEGAWKENWAETKLLATCRAIVIATTMKGKP